MTADDHKSKKPALYWAMLILMFGAFLAVTIAGGSL